QEDASSGRWLGAVLDGADGDAWRQQVRKAWMAGDKAELERLAGAAKVEEQPPSFLLLLANLFLPSTSTARLELLQRIQRAYPGDFWANVGLGRVLFD